MAGSGRHEADAALAVHLAAGLTATEAAVKVGVGERTVRRRLGTPAFRKLVDTVKAEAVTAAVAKLSGNMGKAADKLAALVDSPDDKTALAAAKALLEMALKARAAEDLEHKMRELEARIDALTPPEPHRAKFGED